MRRWFVKVDSYPAFVYCVAYDFVSADRDVAGHALLAVSMVLAITVSADFAAFALLDVVLISRTLRTVIVALTRPLYELIVSTYLIGAVVVAFTVAGLLLFETPGAPSDPPPGAPYDDDFCVSLKRCIMVNVYNGIIDGTMASVSKQISSAGAAYGKGLPTAADLRRMYMQLFFNFVVALLLLNMVAGIIIDTFSQLSQESLEASKIKMNECFTTGLHRSQFETLKEVDFDLDHKPRCAMLNYVHFIGYVMHKDCVNDSPLERVVRDKLRDGDASWIPTLTCFSLENHGQAEREQVGEDEQVRALIADVAARSDARLDALAAAVADLARGAARDRAPTADDARPP